VRSASMIWRAPLNESVAAVRARSGRGRRFMPQRDAVEAATRRRGSRRVIRRNAIAVPVISWTA
jgi:hypothetical protein